MSVSQPVLQKHRRRNDVSGCWTKQQKLLPNHFMCFSDLATGRKSETSSSYAFGLVGEGAVEIYRVGGDALLGAGFFQTTFRPFPWSLALGRGDKIHETLGMCSPARSPNQIKSLSSTCVEFWRSGPFKNYRNTTTCACRSRSFQIPCGCDLCLQLLDEVNQNFLPGYGCARLLQPFSQSIPK